MTALVCGEADGKPSPASNVSLNVAAAVRRTLQLGPPLGDAA